jgi:twitching motility two-component system response regulator PilH
MSQVLLVDDSQVYQEAIANLLKRNGLKVVIACDGVEALEQIQKSNPDLVVLDVVMPRMNGYEVCRRLKSDPRTKNVPVVMCSTKDMAWDRFWGLKIGADAYITKPFEEIEFMGTIKQLLRK